MKETPMEYVGDFAHLLKLRATLGKEQDRLEGEKKKAGTHLKDEISKLRERLEHLHRPFADLEDKLYINIATINKQLSGLWQENNKTQYIEGYIIRRKDMKELDIKDKKALVEELHKLGKLVDSIKKFDESRLRKLAEVDVLSKDNIAIDIKQSISCSKDKKAAPEPVPVFESVQDEPTEADLAAEGEAAAEAGAAQAGAEADADAEAQAQGEAMAEEEAAREQEGGPEQEQQ